MQVHARDDRTIDDLAVEETTDDDSPRRVSAVAAPIIERRPLDAAAARGATRAARHALGHQFQGIAAAMLELARDHALERTQFGRPIGSFQAVRHKLAETLVAVESGAAAMRAADEDPSDLLVDLGRAAAGRSARIAARHCQQVLAGIGFTEEHDFHRFLFRSIELEGLYGDTSCITAALGTKLLDSGKVPRLIQL